MSDPKADRLRLYCGYCRRELPEGFFGWIVCPFCRQMAQAVRKEVLWPGPRDCGVA